jgi:hypothetical protein
VVTALSVRNEGNSPAIADSGFIFFRTNDDSLMRFDPSTLTP